MTGLRAGTMDSKYLGERGIPVSNTHAGNGTSSTAELAWGLIIASMRDLEKGMQNMRSGRWHEGVAAGIGLAGKRLGLIGLGKIGSYVGRVGTAFGMEVAAWSQNLTPEKAAAAGATYVSKEDLFAKADAITIHVVLSDRSRGLVGAADLARMKKTAYLVNTSRGPIIDEAALIATLRDKRIAGAGLDVFDVEPLPLDHPYRTMDNVVITPHLGYVSTQNYAKYFPDIVTDIRAFLDGKPVRVIT